MSEGVSAIAEGVSKEANANLESQMLSAIVTILLISVYVPLTISYMETLNEEQHEYYAYTLDSTIDGDTNYLAEASAEQQAYQQTEAAMNAQTGKINGMISTQESLVRSEGNFMTNTYALEEPLISLQNLLTSQLQVPL